MMDGFNAFVVSGLFAKYDNELLLDCYRLYESIFRVPGN
jgi:hypothetical protein